MKHMHKPNQGNKISETGCTDWSKPIGEKYKEVTEQNRKILKESFEEKFETQSFGYTIHSLSLSNNSIGVEDRFVIYEFITDQLNLFEGNMSRENTVPSFKIRQYNIFVTFIGERAHKRLERDTPNGDIEKELYRIIAALQLKYPQYFPSSDIDN